MMTGSTFPREHCVLDLSYKDVFVIKSFMVSTFCFRKLTHLLMSSMKQTASFLKKIDLITATTFILYPRLVF